MSLLDEATWRGRIFLDGWSTGSGGHYAVVEPATGKEIGRIGAATPADVARTSEVAVTAQRHWAAQPFDTRATVLRRAGDLFAEHAPDILHWLLPETGSFVGKGMFEITSA